MWKLVGIILIAVAAIFFIYYQQLGNPYGFCNSDSDCNWQCGFCKSKINDTEYCGGLLPEGQAYGSCKCVQNKCEGEYTIIPVEKGGLIIAVKDASKKLPQIGTVTGLNLTINSVEVHFVGKDENVTGNETGKWIVFSSDTKTIDLLRYTDIRAIIGEQELAVGKYTQIRLNLSDSEIKIYNLNMGIYNKTYPLKVPSKELKLVHNFNIEQNKTSVLTLDFDLEQSLKKTDQGYILSPTVKILEESVETGQKPANSEEI
jgi:hypothetical protein